MAAVQRLAREADARYSRAAGLARAYINGIESQPDPSNPTGYWRGMREADGAWMDWEMFAGLASGVLADISQLPPYVRKFYRGLFRASGVRRRASGVGGQASGVEPDL